MDVERLNSFEILDEAPLTHSQTGVYLESIKDAENTAYNSPFEYVFPADQLDARQLAQALDAVFARYASFSTRLRIRNDVPTMVLLANGAPKTDYFELTEEEYAEKKASFIRPFKLNMGALARAELVKTERNVYLLFDAHRLVFDGGTLMLVNKALDQAYRGEELTPEEKTIFDYSRLEREHEQSKELQESYDFFDKLLSGVEGATNLMPDLHSQRPGKKRRFQIRLDVDDDALERIVSANETTENVVFLAAFAYALAKFTYQSDALFTSVSSGRRGKRLDNASGMFVRTFPLYFQIDDALTVADYVKYVKTRYLETMSHDDASFVELAERRSISSDVKFVCQGALLDPPVVNSVEGTIAELHSLDPIAKLDFQIFKTQSERTLCVSYRDDLYSEEYVRQFASAYMQIVRGILSAETLEEIDLTTEDDRAFIDQFNATEREYDRSRTVVGLFKDAVARDPNAVAVVYGDRTHTYGELDALTKKIAAFIARKGIGRDRFVAVLVPRDDSMAVCAWGVVRSGAAYLPLDPTYPKEQLNYMVKDSGAKLLVCDRSLRNLLDEYDGPVLYTDEIDDLPADPNFHSYAKPDFFLVLIYTSGTTGKPKGCVLLNRNIVGFYHNHRAIMGFDENSRIAMHTGFGFDAGVMDVFTTLMAGAALYVIPDEIRHDLEKVDEFYCANEITHGFMTTQVGRLFVQKTQSTTLQSFLVGGEKLVPLAVPKGFRFINGYGPSETIGYVCSRLVTDDSPTQPIGKPSGNTKLYVVDKSDRLLPPGACGELCVAGCQVGAGYWRHPIKTMESFVTNPFLDDPHYESMYKTGDVVRLQLNGEIDFIGRRDSQVKVRGFRVELAEIEQAIRKFPGVDDVTVQAFDDDHGGQFIAAYVVGAATLDFNELDAFIADEKPEHMIPAVTMRVDEIPLNVNGKVDKRKLPKPEQKVEHAAKPQTETQQKIFNKVAKVVGTEEFGVHTSLYAAGLSSRKILELNALLADEFGIAIQIKDIQEHDTVVKLERFILANAGTKETFDVLDDYPLTKTQEGVYIESQKNPKSDAYNIPLVLRLDPTLNDAKLKEAIVKTINARQYLMTVFFTNEDGNIRQKRDDSRVFDPSEVELLEVDSFDAIQDELVQPFDLQNGRLFRAKLIRANKGSEFYLFFDVHHMIADKASVAILVNDFQKAYAGETIEQERFSGYEVAALEQNKRQRETYANAIAFYDALFENVETDCLPIPDVHPDRAIKGTKRLVIGQSEALAEKTLDFCKKNNLNVNGLLCSVFGFTLAKYNASDSAVFNTIYDGRTDSRTLNTVALLVKTLPLVVDIEKKTPVSLTREISKQLTDSKANDVYSFAELTRNYEVKNDVVFIYRGDDFNFNEFCESPCEYIVPPLSDKKAPIAFQVQLEWGKFVYKLEYDGALFTEKFIETFARSFDKALSEFLRCSKLSNVSLLTSETEAEMDAFNQTENEYDDSKNVVELFREQVEKFPDELAVSFKSAAFTYKELDAITDKLAAYIVDKGVGRDEFVSILVPRNEFMPIGAMGVLKSGAAYQPLDPSYPRERLALMIKDIGSKLLIVDRELFRLVGDYRGHVLYTDEIAALLDAKPTGVEITPENALVVTYTSGTTGTPKGSVHEHRNVVCFEHYHTRASEIAQGSRIAASASFGFDASIMDIFAALTTGAALFIVPDDTRLDVDRLEEFYCANKITNGFLTTQLARSFCSATKCPTLKNMIIGGEKLIPFEPPKNVACYNGYGPSETLAYVTLYRIQDESAYQPIGLPNWNTKLYVVDKFGNRLPFGACGELCVSGGQLARGYFQRPERTAKVFVSNPFSDKPGYERMYRTGDVARQLTDGNFDFVGRRDSQVKIRGNRVELTEIEQIVRDFPGVRNATVQAFDNPSGGKYIAAFVVGDSPIDADALNAYVRSKKPPYMVPAVTTQLDAIPTTSNGKVDQRKLPKPAQVAIKTGLEPENDTESAFCEIFENVLHLDKVYADDDFFQIGGASISAVQALVKAKAAGFSITYKNLFDNPTPRLLAVFVQQRKTTDVFAPSGAEKEKYDYSALEYNAPANLDAIGNAGVGDVLLTGVTSFLGSYVFKELLTTTDGAVVCVVRKKNGRAAKERFETIMKRRFGTWFQESFYKRVAVVEGELGDPDVDKKLAAYRFDTIVNCAGNFRRYVKGDASVEDNFGGVEPLVRLAEKTGAKLVQASSLSVAGESVDGNVPLDFKFAENCLNVGQALPNKYVYSKYLAEQAIIDATSRGKIRGKIIRLGNLTAREEDGEFQVNASTSAFVKQMLGYRKLGCYPVDMMDAELEFSPIDYAAKAFVLLAGTPDEFTVFHAQNCHKVHYGYFVNAMNKLGLHVSIVDKDAFVERFKSALQDANDAAAFTGLVAYLARVDAADAGQDAKKEEYQLRVRIGSDTSYTTKALYRLGFAWPLTHPEYLDKMVKLLAEIEYFKTN